MARPISVVDLTAEEKAQLQRLSPSKTGSQRDGLRARMVLRRSESMAETEVARVLGISLTTVSLWSRRFELEA